MSQYKIFQPMKYGVAKSMDILKEALESDDYCLELKLDGASYTLAKDSDGTVHLYGDKISKKTGEIIDKIENVPHLKQFAERHFPPESQILVEITCRYDWTTNEWREKSNSKYVNSIMLSNPDKAVLRQKQTELCNAYMFDILFWGGEPQYQKDFIDRYNLLRELYADWESAYPWLSCAEAVFEDKSEKITEWLANGEEGGVLKLLRSKGKISAAHAISEIGATAKRPAHTSYKIKQVDTIDVVILGVEWPEKVYKGKDPENAQYKEDDGTPINRLYALGMINAFNIGLYRDGEFVAIGTVASGLDDDIRLSAASHPEEWINTVIECDCMSIDKEGHSLRHPRFMRTRPDKAPEQCRWEDIF